MISIEHFFSWPRLLGIVAMSSLANCGPNHGGDPDGEAGSGGHGAGGGGAPAGSGGLVGSSGLVGSGGLAGSAGAPGYDEVIGCPAARWPAQATLTLIDAASGDFAVQAISGDGRVVGGQWQGTTARFTPTGGIVPVTDLDDRVSALDCDGSVLVTADTSSGAWRQQLGESAAPVLSGDGYYWPEPLSLTPDGSVIVGHLIGTNDPGPHPMRWTAATGAQLIEPLDNTLVYHVDPDGRTVLGLDVLQIFRFTLGGTKQLVQARVPPAGQITPRMLVSADGRSYTFNWDDDYDSFYARAVLGEVPCPGAPCTPVAISGTGKVMLVVSRTGPAPSDGSQTYVWTEAHGLRALNALMIEHGVTPPGTLFANAMSEDGQAFAGYMDNPNGAPSASFYATLPPSAYE